MEKIGQNKYFEEIINNLYEKGVCSRCLLRLFRVQNYQLYRQKSQLLIALGKFNENFLQSYNAQKLINNKFQNCSVCLGILQMIDGKNVVQKISKTVKQSRFVFEKFKLFVKVPLTSDLRFALVNMYILYMLQKKKQVQENFEQFKFAYCFFDQWNNNSIKLKTVIKWIIAPILSNILNCQSSIEDDSFIIELQYLNQYEDMKNFEMFKEVLIKIAEQQENKDHPFKKRKLQKNHKREHINKQKYSATTKNVEKITKMNKFLIFQKILNKQFLFSTSKQSNLQIKLNSKNIFIKGFYIKFSRFIPQTPWILNGNQPYQTSIQQEVQTKLFSIFHPQRNFSSIECKFHSGGREDIDVRMLGEGRPFAIEICNPKIRKDVNLKQIEKQINKSKYINVGMLEYGNEDCFKWLKKSQIEKIKLYACIVTFNQSITQKQIVMLNQIEKLKIEQKTPIRVLHRRTLMTREKWIYKMKAKKISQKLILLYVLSSAGTYIKQFIHGDLFRTVPNVCSLLGKEVDIYQLDVIKLYDNYCEQIIEDFNKIQIAI